MFSLHSTVYLLYAQNVKHPFKKSMLASMSDREYLINNLHALEL